MRFNFTEYPKQVDRETYLSEINKMSDKLMKTDLVHSVFQVGGVSHPGISDIDLLIVFKDEVEYLSNPVSGLSFPANYLFTHRLFGTGKRQAASIEKFTFFNNYKLIAGDNMNMNQHSLTTDEIKQLKPQIALEYLIKAYVAIQIGIEYRTIKIRSFLLHAKAIKYDLEFLDISDNNLHEVIDQVVELRSEWFKQKVKDSQLEDLIISYRDVLIKAIMIALDKYKLFLSIQSPYKLSRNVELTKSDHIKFERTGLLPMYLLSLNLPYLIKLINRMNSFKIHIPFEYKNIPEILRERHDYMVNSFRYNKKYLPDFICTGHGLNTFNG